LVGHSKTPPHVGDEAAELGDASSRDRDTLGTRIFDTAAFLHVLVLEYLCDERQGAIRPQHEVMPQWRILYSDRVNERPGLVERTHGTLQPCLV
jgi:hypothetical protein